MAFKDASMFIYDSVGVQLVPKLFKMSLNRFSSVESSTLVLVFSRQYNKRVRDMRQLPGRDVNMAGHRSASFQMIKATMPRAVHHLSRCLIK